jgi:outer membrane protein
MQQYHGTAAKRHQVEEQARVWQNSLDSLSAKLSPNLSAAEQEARLAPQRSRYQQSLQKVSQTADQELLSDVNAYIKRFGETNKYELIFGATESGNVVYAAPANDLTQEIIEGLNQQYDKRHTDSH